jgi:hypothetical protein
MRYLNPDVDDMTVANWSEWVAYIAGPTQSTLAGLVRRADSLANRAAILAPMEAMVGTAGSWIIAQHCSVLHRQAGHLTEAWYFAHIARERSDGDVRALIAMADAFEARRLPSATFPILDVVRIQLRRIRGSDRQRYRQYLTEAYVRTYASFCNPDAAARWWRAARLQATIRRDTLVVLLLCAWTAQRITLLREVAMRLSVDLHEYGPRVRGPVERTIRAHFLETLRTPARLLVDQLQERRDEF